MNLTDNSFLNDIINNPHKISELEFDNISKIFKTAKNIFEEEFLLLEFNVKEDVEEVYVIGDIHGNLNTLMKLIEIINKNKPKLVIFLGDIVDRGSKQLECLLIVLILKILFPLKYYILRGNHETLEMNEYYGFFQDFILRFNDRNKFNEILNIYNVLPICALINGTILCLHGGISQDFDILTKLKNQKCKDFEIVYNSIAQGIYQIMWNDPKAELKGFSDSFRGAGIFFFGIDVFENFMKVNALTYLIRAHECFPEGFRWFFNKKLLSIFSSANYRGFYAPNPASYAIIKNNEIIPKLLKL
ncbi:MAG: metallophosphoesterase [Candidatus Lokiarchaeota archaeon]|nr:metallophosphoesterase [Candidatus Lokiarchaeota archaeon]